MRYQKTRFQTFEIIDDSVLFFIYFLRGIGRWMSALLYVCRWPLSSPPFYTFRIRLKEDRCVKW